MSDLLLELLSEEIPARMQAKARADLTRLLTDQLAVAGLKPEGIETHSTPRRLALIARGLPLGTPAVSEELKGPRTSAPPQALDGFLRKTGLTAEQLEDRAGIWFAVVDKPGRATTEVLAETIPAIVRAFPWPKSMRWGAESLSTESLRWVRPLQGIVAMLDEEVIEFEVGDVQAGAATVGHRFHHPGRITLAGASDYVEKLRACHVIVNQDERARLIRDGAAALAAEHGLALAPDEGLVEENAGLTEWPAPLLGRFDPAFLEVPREVIQLTMRTNQKYFAVTNGAGALAPAFICVANIAARDGGARIVEGNQKVLAARLSDARFFLEQDLKVPLEGQAAKLSQIVFHEKLGTVADKVERVAKLARWLVEEGIVGGSSHSSATIHVRVERSGDTPSEDQSFSTSLEANGPSLADLAQKAAELCKADLVTQMVGEFPELQGLIGGYLAAAQGEPPEVAAAIRDHYKPVGQGDDVPTAPVTVAVSLADKLDTLVSFFFAEMPPTGSKDPFALRRAALGAIELVTRNELRVSLSETITRSLGGMTDLRMSSDMPDAAYDAHSFSMRQTFVTLPAFFTDRLKVQQREAGVRHDLIDAVFALGGQDDLVRLLARVRALQAFVETREGADLLAGYKRAANILKKEGFSTSLEASGDKDAVRVERSRDTPSSLHNPLSYSPEREETALVAALDAAEPRAAAAIEREDFEAAMIALATLRAPVDAFFDKVTVNDPDPARRAARLDLLARVRAAVHQVADFSKIEG